MQELNGDDPVARLRYVEAHGPDAYNKAMEEWHRKSTVAVVNGHAIREVRSARFGRIFMVDGVNRGHPEFERAMMIAQQEPHGDAPLPNRVSERACLLVGQRVICNGYLGTVRVLYADGATEGARTYEVRLASGTVAVAGSELQPIRPGVLR